MRKYLVAGLAGVLALALTAVAIAAQVNKADIKFTGTKKGSTVGISSTFNISDPGNTTPGQEGKPTRQIRQVNINFPAKTVINYKSYAKKYPCPYKAAAQIEAKCKKALIATGTTTIDGRGGLLDSFGGIVNGTLKAYNNAKGLAIIVKANDKNGQPIPGVNNSVLLPEFKGTKLVTVLPTTLSAPGVDAYLSKFKLVIKKKSFKPKGKKKAIGYTVLPKKCPAGKQWKVKTTFFYKAGGSFTTPGTVNKCK